MAKKISTPRCAFYAVVAAHFWFSCYYDWCYAKVPEQSHPMGSTFFNTGKLKFLTFWDAIIQAAFFTVCLANDVLGTNERNPLRLIKDTMLAAVAYPLSMLVGLTFWILYAIDRELIFPKALDEFFPSWLNHAMHTNIMVFVLIEMFVSFRRYPRRSIGFGLLCVVLLAYLVWIHVIHAYTGVWVYPFLAVLNLPLRLAFFVVMLAVSFAVYVSGEKLNAIIWSKALKGKKAA